MELSELIPKLVEHYQKCIERMPYSGWSMYLAKNNIDDGICYCAKYQFGCNILYGSEFARKFTNDRAYLCKTPEMSIGRKEVIESLQTRLNRLKEFI